MKLSFQLNFKLMVKQFFSLMLVMIVVPYASAQSKGQPPKSIVLVNGLWDKKQTFSKAYDYCIKNYEDSSKSNAIAKEKWMAENEMNFSKIDRFFEKFLEFRLKYGGVDKESASVDSLLSEYNEGVEKTVLNLFKAFGDKGGEYCSVLEERVDAMTEGMNSQLAENEALLEATFK